MGCSTSIAAMAHAFDPGGAPAAGCGRPPCSKPPRRLCSRCGSRANCRPMAMRRCPNPDRRRRALGFRAAVTGGAGMARPDRFSMPTPCGRVELRGFFGMAPQDAEPLSPPRGCPPQTRGPGAAAAIRAGCCPVRRSGVGPRGCATRRLRVGAVQTTAPAPAAAGSGNSARHRGWCGRGPGRPRPGGGPDRAYDSSPPNSSQARSAWAAYISDGPPPM